MITGEETDKAKGSIARPGSLVVDCLAIVGLVLVGRLSHGDSVLTDPLSATIAVIPFVGGWLLVALLTGLYATAASSNDGRQLALVLVCWLAAANVGFLLRGSPVLPGGVPWEFTVVFTGIGSLVLLSIHGGRLLFRSVSLTR